MSHCGVVVEFNVEMIRSDVVVLYAIAENIRILSYDQDGRRE